MLEGRRGRKTEDREKLELIRMRYQRFRIHQSASFVGQPSFSSTLSHAPIRKSRLAVSLKVNTSNRSIRRAEPAGNRLSTAALVLATASLPRPLRQSDQQTPPLHGRLLSHFHFVSWGSANGVWWWWWWRWWFSFLRRGVICACVLVIKPSVVLRTSGFATSDECWLCATRVQQCSHSGFNIAILYTSTSHSTHDSSSTDVQRVAQLHPCSWTYLLAVRRSQLLR